MARKFHHHIADVVDQVGVVACRARHAVGTRAAVQAVVGGVAHQRVGVGAAHQVFNTDVAVACGFAGVGAEQVQARREACCGTGVADGVDAAAADQLVRTCAAFEDVVARAAVNEVVARIARQSVVVGRADEVFYRDEAVAQSVAGIRRSRQKVDSDARQSAHVARGVYARAAIN